MGMTFNLLHEDSHLTTCEYSGLVESPTRCEDQPIFSDPRPGRQSGATILMLSFLKSYFAAP